MHLTPKPCVRCGETFMLTDHLKMLSDLGFTPEQIASGVIDFKPLFSLCPACADYKSLHHSSPPAPPWAPHPPRSVPTRRPLSPSSSSGILFWLLAILAVAVPAYSLAARHIGAPSIDIRTYIVAFTALLLFAFPVRFSPLHALAVLGNFAIPSFRASFLSHFGSTFGQVAMGLLFCLANIGTLNVFGGYLAHSLIKPRGDGSVVRPSAGLAVMFLPFILFAGLISPFYLAPSQPASVVIPHETVTSVDADRGIAYKYLIEGVRAGSLGTRKGFDDSFDMFRRALELDPTLSSAHAEIAYAHASLGRILAQAKADPAESRERFRLANAALGSARRIEQPNPRIMAVAALAKAYAGEHEEALTSLDSAQALAKSLGSFDLRTIQAMTLLTPKRQDRLGPMHRVLTDPPPAEGLEDRLEPLRNSAEFNNLMGLSFYQTGNSERARGYFEKAILLSPAYGEARVNLALVASRPDRADLLRQAAYHCPDVVPIASSYVTLGSVQRWLPFVLYALLASWLVSSIVLIARNADVATKRLLPGLAGKLRRSMWTHFALGGVLYMGFEWYIHHFRPVHGVMHMFPIDFPFF